GHTSLLLAKLEPNSPWRASLLEVEKSAAWAAEISNDLAAFSRQEKEVRPQSTGNINSLLQKCVEFFKRDPAATAQASPPQSTSPQTVTQSAQPAASIAWKLQLDRRLFVCKCDELKIQQAFLRVIENSVQAIPVQGQIRISSRN